MRIINVLKNTVKLLMFDKKSWGMLKWILMRGDSSLRVEYDLGPDSVVFDVGGYHGDWASQIATKYNSNIHIFEPIKDYCREIELKFGTTPKIIINEFGLSNKTENHLIAIKEDGSSVISLEGDVTEIKLIDIYEYINDHNIKSINLIKINIEGGEYALLNRMHEKDLIKKCIDIQIQFHDFFPDATIHRNKLKEVLNKTHHITYDFPFIWENWHIRENLNK